MAWVFVSSFCLTIPNVHSLHRRGEKRCVSYRICRMHFQLLLHIAVVLVETVVVFAQLSDSSSAIVLGM
jgi:hypothetical protein